MIAVDTNILVHAHRSDSSFHARARSALEMLAAGVRQWAIPWPCAHEFFAIVTHPRIFRTATPALTGRIAGGTIHDARIAAICLSHGVSELWSADRDFSRFPALVIRNPLIEDTRRT